MRTINRNKAHLGESSDSVLIGEKRRIIPNLEVKVNCLVREGGELIAEAELVGPVLGCCKRKTVILLLHFLVECSAIRVLQTTVHVIVATGYYLRIQRTEGALLITVTDMMPLINFFVQTTPTNTG